jgi:hypothetical protein
MSVVSITEAARLVGRNRKTIYKYLSSGSLSSVSMAAGGRGIDTSELIRVFGEFVKNVDGHGQDEKQHQVTHKIVQDDHVVPGKSVDALIEQVEGLKAVVEAQRSHIVSLENTVRLLEYDKGRDQGNVHGRLWWKFW